MDESEQQYDTVPDVYQQQTGYNETDQYAVMEDDNDVYAQMDNAGDSSYGVIDYAPPPPPVDPMDFLPDPDPIEEDALT